MEFLLGMEMISVLSGFHALGISLWSNNVIIMFHSWYDFIDFGESILLLNDLLNKSDVILAYILILYIIYTNCKFLYLLEIANVLTRRKCFRRLWLLIIDFLRQGVMFFHITYGVYFLEKRNIFSYVHIGK